MNAVNGVPAGGPHGYSDEQREFGEAARQFLVSYQPMYRVRELAADEVGRDSELWRRAAKELDIQGLMVPQEFGGSGFGFAEASLVLTAAGESLASWPYLSSAVLATHCLMASGDDEAKARWLPSMSSGDMIATVAVADDAGDWRVDNASVKAAAGPDRTWTLDGHKSYVIDGQLADLLLVLANEGTAVSLFAVRTDAAGLARAQLPTLDATRKLSRFTFDNAAAERIGTAEATAHLGTTLTTIAAAALACESAGGIAATGVITTDYAKLRKQYGRSIGSFQSIKHRCVEMYIRSEAAAAFAESTALLVDEAIREDTLRTPEIQAAVATAATYCSEGFIHNAHDMIQVHGGIGFTWEHDAHLFLRRAASSAKLFGAESRQMAVLCDQIQFGPLLARQAVGVEESRA